MHFKTFIRKPKFLKKQKFAKPPFIFRELHESACVAKHWSIVRHTHGLLAKKMQNMELSVMDLIVRQKQVTVGLPPDNEVIISQPLCSAELRELIYTTSGGDISTAALTQEKT